MYFSYPLKCQHVIIFHDRMHLNKDLYAWSQQHSPIALFFSIEIQKTQPTFEPGHPILACRPTNTDKQPSPFSSIQLYLHSIVYSSLVSWHFTDISHDEKVILSPGQFLQTPSVSGADHRHQSSVLGWKWNVSLLVSVSRWFANLVCVFWFSSPWRTGLWGYLLLTVSLNKR